MMLTTEESNSLNSIHEKYNALCDSFEKCSECPMDFVVIDKHTQRFERGCLVACIGYALAKYR